MKSVGLYIHIPFCKNKCGYCSFYSNNKLQNIPCYIESLKENIKRFSADFNAENFNVNSIFFGGGTPSVVGSENILNVLSSIRKHYNVAPDCEITVEVNPESSSYSFFTDLKQGSINRISIGIQSFNDNELRLLGRIHDSKTAIDAVNNAKKAGFDNINIDLIAAIPGSDKNSLFFNLTMLKELDIPHVCVYCLNIEEGTPFYTTRDTLQLLNDDEEFEMYELVHNFLYNNGYNHYEISGFAKPGYKCRHNLKYWNFDDYLGFGPAAHSYFNSKRFYIEEDTDKYLHDTIEIINEQQDNDGLFDYIMLSLRTDNGIDLNKCREMIPVDKYDAFLYKINRVIALGYGKIQNNRFSLNYKGMFISNSIILELV